ncbi:GroES-like protein [Clavulina sp. PMI_390]|nr:GroES-like protein [Clavulina sp. PMI_390]
MSERTQRALVIAATGKTKIITSKAYPRVSPNEVIIKVKAVTLNPTDWMHLDAYMGPLAPDTSLGSDFAGDVVELGAEAQNKARCWLTFVLNISCILTYNSNMDVIFQGFKVGDGVAGFTRGGALDKDNGSFQEYIKMRTEHIWHKPSSLPYEDASSMGGIALSTAAYSLIYLLGLPKPWEPRPENVAPILIWAGSTSVGLYAISLAKLCDDRIPVITTASPHSFDLVKSRGADVVFDYKDPEVSQKIKDWAKEQGYAEGILKGLDCISSHGSTTLATEAMGGGMLNVLLMVSPEEGKSWPNGVDVSFVVIYSVLDPKNEKAFASVYEWNQQLPTLITEKNFGNSNPLEVSNGLENIPDGLERLRAGKVSGSKLAYII